MEFFGRIGSSLALVNGVVVRRSRRLCINTSFLCLGITFFRQDAVCNMHMRSTTDECRSDLIISGAPTNR